MPLMIAEYVVRVAIELSDGEDIENFLIDAAQRPGPFLAGNLAQPHTAVKLIRSGSKGSYRYTDPVLAKASRRRAWKAIRGNRSDPDQTTLEAAIVSGLAAAVGDEEAAAAAASGGTEEAQPLAASDTSEATLASIAADADAAESDAIATEAAAAAANTDAPTQPAAE